MIAAVSPHLDDAVFACGALLGAHPGSVVVTALAGGPPPGPRRWAQVTTWDAACGFSAGDDVIAARRAEDREALGHLGATPVWLDHPDAQYGPSPPVEALSGELRRALEPLCAETVAIPLGLFHSDHLLVAEAALRAVTAEGTAGRSRSRRDRVLVYEDAMYRRIDGLAREALARLARRGWTPVHEGFSPPPEALERKRRAVHCYRSQLRGLASPGRPGHEDALSPERLWRISG